MDTEMLEAPERRVYSHSEKICLQKLIYKYKLHCVSGLGSKETIIRKHAWAHVTQEFNSIETNSCRTTAQLKRCWENIKARKKQALRKRMATAPVLVSYEADTTPEHNDEVDPLTAVKNEHHNNDIISWNNDKNGDQHYAVANEFVTAEVSAETPSQSQHQYSPRLSENDLIISSRSDQREEELHKLKVAEKLWSLKILKEQHRKAQLDREKAQLEREKAQIERDKAQFERNKAELELNRASRNEEVDNR